MKSVQVSKQNWKNISEIRRKHNAKNNNDIITALLDLYNQSEMQQ